jgi:glycosyltransferase involved in cell wall biosynthesis
MINRAGRANPPLPDGPPDRRGPTMDWMDTQSPYSVSIVLPAYNEDANIETAVRRAGEVADRLCADHEVIVVDDGSADGTAEIVRRLRAADPRVVLVQHPRNLGYGEALKSGFGAASMDLVFLTDADNQFVLDEIEDFLELIEQADVVAGHRVHRSDPWFRRINARMWNYLVRTLYYVPVRDVDCAFKLFRREVFEGVTLDSGGAMVSTELMVTLSRSGYRILERGVTHLPRTAGKPQGANLHVIARAFRELARLHGKLSGMEQSLLKVRD